MEEPMIEFVVILLFLMAKRRQRLSNIRRERQANLLLDAAQGLVQLSTLLAAPSASMIFYRLLRLVRSQKAGDSRFYLECYKDGIEDIVGFWDRSGGQLIFEIRVVEGDQTNVFFFRTEDSALRPLGVMNLYDFLDSADVVIRSRRYSYAA
jgi:hypothetical protein